MIRKLLKRWIGKETPVMLLQHGAICQWETTPVPPYTVQRFSGLFISGLTIAEKYETLHPAVARAWHLAYPYQANMIVQVVDDRNSIVLGHDHQDQFVATYGAEGVWFGTQAAFDVLRDTAEDTALVGFLEQRARTATRSVCPSV